ncbi:beta-lactamase family protein [Sphingobacterium sp. lm-10]|uniref:serine hydrolase domain-containing protein n=1 Tax=Sphingobacterium sp. lm-10 TaxID=2944904 RepID=UPI0020214153|nr:serine hydrolase [Sphingobacterium sp. lm-10]MCL7986512.1 beta-lactamase family protein [Sphingobacterium sp. lm-10]
MHKIWKFFAAFIGFVVLAIAGMYVFGLGYIMKGMYVTYLHGHKTAYLSDYQYFDNHLVQHEAGRPWPAAQPQNRIQLPDSLRQFHEDIQSVAYLIIQRDSIVLETYFDGYEADSKSNSFSMAKSIVAAILGKVITEGKIKSLDQKVLDFVPEIKGEYASELTLRDLVSMSSGMKWEEDYYSPFSVTTKLYFDQNILKVITELPIYKKPGEEFIYQSGDTQLLGIAIQRATGQSLSELLSTYFWKPMQAEHDALWQVDSEANGIEKAYCCIASNALDFARFGKLYRDHGRWNGQQLLDSAYVHASLQPRFENSPEYGYGWWMGSFDQKPYFYMNGHLGQYVITIPEDDLIIVRLGHQTDKLSASNPASNFYQFIAHAYQLIDK